MNDQTSIRASIILPTYNRGEILMETVRLFSAQLTEKDEIIIIDQSDIPVAEVEKYCTPLANVHYFHITEKGLPNARNVGILAAQGEIIIFSDDDVIPEKTFIQAHLKPYQEPDVGAVAGRIIEKVPRPQLFANQKEIGRLRKFDGHITRNFEADTHSDVDHFPGGNMSMRRDLVCRINGFDKRFAGTAHLEETDVASRLRRQGYRIVFEPEASLLHLSLSSGGCRELNMNNWLYWYGHNYMLFALKNLPRIYFPIFLAARLAKLMITSIKKAKFSLFVQGLKGLRDGWLAYRKPLSNHFQEGT